MSTQKFIVKILKPVEGFPDGERVALTPNDAIQDLHVEWVTRGLPEFVLAKATDEQGRIFECVSRAIWCPLIGRKGGVKVPVSEKKRKLAIRWQEAHKDFGLPVPSYEELLSDGLLEMKEENKDECA